MTGLDKILSKISADTQSECDAVIKSAEKKCESIIEQGKAEGEKTAADIISSAKVQAEKTVEIAQSSAEQIIKQNLLKAKVDVINETLAQVVDELKNLPADEYFKAVIKIAGDNAMSGKCTAKLGSADNGRLPADFEQNLITALSAKGAECTLSKDNATVDSGIILDYGDIVINCSFEAIVEENADEYKAIISKILF